MVNIDKQILQIEYSIATDVKAPLNNEKRQEGKDKSVKNQLVNQQEAFAIILGQNSQDKMVGHRHNNHKPLKLYGPK